MNSARLWQLLTVVLGAATLAAFASFSLVQDAFQGAALSNAVSGFQRSELGTPISSLFASWAEIQAMDRVNQADLYAFIPAYALFLSAAAIMLGEFRPLVFAAVLAALVGAIADVVETLAQLRVTAALTEQNWNAAITSESIAPMHWLKYGALAVNGLSVALICLAGAPRRWVLGVIALLPLPAVAAAYLGYAEPRVFSMTLALYWIALLAAAIVSLVRAKGASA